MTSVTASRRTTTAQPADPYARSGELDDATAELLAARLEVRGAEPRQRLLRQSILSRIPRRPDTRVLEVGCGTGVVTREVAALAGVVEVTGVDPCRQFVEHARTAAAGAGAEVTYQVADGRTLPFPDRRFDVVVFATTLCHIPGPDAALEEAFRVLAPGGTLLVFDGDYATTTVSLARHDPLQTCVAAAVVSLVHDPRLVRRLAAVVAAAGFAALDAESHGYAEVEGGTYLPTVVAFGAQALASDGVIATELAEALVAEVDRRIRAGVFFGHIAYMSLLATRPHKEELPCQAPLRRP